MNEMATIDRGPGMPTAPQAEVASAPSHVVVIVGSAGSREPLQTIIDALARDLAAAVLVPSLISAAETYGTRAVGIVLSGADANGAAGLAALKQAGGIAMVQLPEEARFSRMPLAALSMGAVDLCAPAAELAQALSKLCAPVRPSP